MALASRPRWFTKLSKYVKKVQFTLFFYLKQNEEVQLHLQRSEIFIFSSLLPSLLPGKMKEEKLPLPNFCDSEYA